VVRRRPTGAGAGWFDWAAERWRYWESQALSSSTIEFPVR
jgi:hypothetical protein